MLKELEILNFNGMVTNRATPGKNEAQLVENFDIHEKPGTLVLRRGYELKYAAPSDDRIDPFGFISFSNFYEKTAIEDTDEDIVEGQEITILLEQGEVYSEEFPTDDVNTQLQPCIWARPSWDGADWVDEWDWLNEVVITKVKTATDATYQSMIHLTTDKADDYFVGWTMWNKTQNVVSQIITSKLDSGGNRVNHTLFNSSFTVDDIIYLYRNYLSPTYLDEMYNVNAYEINYHTILNDLRIGFGGFENRVGLSVGYRSKYFKIKEFDFTPLHADLDTTALEAFSFVNGLVVDEFSFVSKPYGIILTAATGTLAPNTYYFRLTGLLDDNSELLLAESSLTVGGSDLIQVRPYMTMGNHNKRITDFKVYYSTDGNSYFKLFSSPIASDNLSATDYKINEDGQLISTGTVELSLLESAVTPLDLDNTNGWHGDMTLTTTTDAVNDYAIFAVPYIFGLMFQSISGIVQGGSHSLSVWTKATGSPSQLTIYFANSALPYTPLSNSINLSMTGTYVETTGTLVPTSSDVDLVVIRHHNSAVGGAFIDELTITTPIPDLEDTTEPGSEISAEMGYTPSFNVVKDWEQCEIRNGRAYYMNPFIDKELDNFIMVSHISAGYMYDAVTAGRFLETDKFDGTKPVAIAFLTNVDLLVLRQTSIQIINPEDNFIRVTGFGKGCISRRSVVPIGDMVFWAGSEDIHSIDPSKGLQVTELLQDTIRDLYRGRQEKNKVVGIRDKHNTYRFRLHINDDGGSEFLLTNRGWVKHRKHNYAEVFRVGFNYNVWFMEEGDIYQMDDEIDYSPSNILIDDDGVVAL